MVYNLDYGARSERRVKNNPDKMKNSKKILYFGIVFSMLLYLREFLPYIHIEFRRESVLEKSNSLSREAHRRVKVCFRSEDTLLLTLAVGLNFLLRKNQFLRRLLFRKIENLCEIIFGWIFLKSQSMFTRCSLTVKL